MVLTQLEQFKVIAEQENISKAAQILYVSQPSLSQMLNKLEEEVGCKLFDRKGGRIHLNANGRLALEHINVILEEVDFLKEKLAQQAARKEPIILGSPSPSVIWYFASKLREYLPDTHFRTMAVEQNQIGRALKKQEIDFAFSYEYINDNEISCMPYSEVRHFITLHRDHPLANESALYLKQLAGSRLLTMAGPPTYTGKHSRPFLDSINVQIDYSDDPLIFYNMLLNDSRYVTVSASTEIRANKHIYGNRKIVAIKDKIPPLPLYCSYWKRNPKCVTEIQNTLITHYQDIM